MKASDININESLNIGLLIEVDKESGKRVVVTHNLKERIDQHTTKCKPSEMMKKVVAEAAKIINEKKEKKKAITKPIKTKISINEDMSDGKRIKYASIKAIELGDFLLIAENKDALETFM